MTISAVNAWVWFMVGFILGWLESEWPLYTTAIGWLALKKRELPLRLTMFLECCRACGLLRVIGQEYQIHDVDLLGHLVLRGARIEHQRAIRSGHAEDGTRAA